MPESGVDEGGQIDDVADQISVAVVDAKTPGNIGTIARAMKNYGFERLLLVDPPDIGRGTEAYGFAGQAREDILPNARELSFETLTTEFHTIGFTARANRTDTKHVRYPILTPAQLPDRLRGVEADTALVFGRERIGLMNDELTALDELCTIPAHPEYPTLNLGQAATIALYELRSLSLGSGGDQLPEDLHQRADQIELDALFGHIDELLDTLSYPPERRPKAEGMFRRVLGRADLTSREIATLHGVLQRCEYAAKNPIGNCSDDATDVPQDRR